MSRNRKDAIAIGHHRVLAFANDSKADFFKRFDCPLVVDALNLGHKLRLNFNFMNFLFFTEHIHSFEVLTNGILYVIERFLLIDALRVAAWQPEDRRGDSLFRMLENNSITHHETSVGK